MAQIRTLKLNLLADVTKFGAGMVEARGDINKLSTTATRAGKAVAAAFTGMAIAAGYAAVAMGKDAVTSALEDEAGQERLKKALENTTKATDDQVKSVEKWITAQQYATGFTDSELRVSLGKLVGVTKDVTEAQKLNVLAQDVARGTGKDLASITDALVKAHEGNLGALTRLGVPLEESTKKTGDFTQATKDLTALFGGQASTYADTYQGKLDIVNQRIGELKEGIGAKLIDKFGGLLTIVNEVAKGFGGENVNEGLSGSIQKFNRATGIDPKTAGYSLGESLKTVANSFTKLFDTITSDKSKEGTSNLERLADAMNTIAGAINNVTTAYTKGVTAFDWLENKSWLGRAVNFVTNNPAREGRAGGGSVRAGQAYTVGEFGKETFIPSTNGRIVPNAMGGGTVINISGAIDPEGVRRQLERLFQDSGRRTAAVNLAGSPL